MIVGVIKRSYDAMERAYWIILSYVAVKQETQERILRYAITLSLAGVFLISAVVNIPNRGGKFWGNEQRS